MITIKNFEDLLKALNFEKEGNTYQKSFGEANLFGGATLKVDFDNNKITYPDKLTVNRDDICNLLQNENFVVFECVHRLLKKGYKPEHLELEPSWQVGHGASGGRADILVKDHENNPLLLIECKTAGKEFERAWRKTEQNGDQLFSYAQQIPRTQYLCLYASDFDKSKIHLYQRIIAHRDNAAILKQNESLRRFSEATDVEDRFAIWCETYEQEYTEGGIFEENIQPYDIGKNKFTLEDDTRPIDAADAKKDNGKFNQFAEILRTHTIARREQAFEVLVNLFLCKLVDEENNKTDLQFSWKGIAYDNYFDFVDRLQNLYQTGMNKYLGKKISYISNQEIDNAFWAVKNDRNATKKKIQEYFRRLKFFTNTAFSLLDTHNEDLFKRNVKVLLEIVQKWQGIRLKTEEQNPFLGELFELFLDSGIKQSEGQFFTPLPICKFIVSSLPLAQRIEENAEPLKAIDFACGSGHFLNEYAHQIRSLVEEEKRELYYHQILGIEKEDRLAKVAKVAAYMHGQEQIKILDADALASHPEIPSESFDVLVANPPYAVDGFLDILNDEDKKQYQLIQTINKNSNTDAIECFFLERIHHLMAPNGIVAVIVRESIKSNNDAVYVGAREILLQYFDLISIVELGSKTFWKTTTRTVVLFLRRKEPRPEVSEQYYNRVKDFFEGDEENEIYEDDELIKAYCNHIEVPIEEYIKLFNQTSLEPLTKLLEYDIFKEYQQDFNPDKTLEKIKKSKEFRNMTDEEQSEECGRQFINYLHTKERDKLHYFILAHKQDNEVLIVNSPTTNKRQKQFWGYDWSDRRGNEGIRYNSGYTVDDIVTPLFDPNNLDNNTKINTAIKRNFIDQPIDPLPEHCHYASLTDMLDFSLTDFNKALNLNPRQNIDIESKWERKTIGNLLMEIDGNKTKIPESEIVEEGETAVVTQEKDILISGYTDKKEVITDLPLIVFGDHSCAFKYIDFPFIRGADGTQLLKVNENELLPKCFYYLIQLLEIPNKNRYERHFKYLKKLKIPVPPFEEQQQIADECETVDQQTDQARQTITTARQIIEEKVQAVINAGHNLIKLGMLVNMVRGITYDKSQESIAPTSKIILTADNITLEGTFELKKQIFLNDSVELDDEKKLMANDIFICISSGSRKHVGKVAYIKHNTEYYAGGFMGILRNKSTHYLSRYLFELLNTETYRNIVRNTSTGSNIQNLSNILQQITIPVPPLNIQQQLVAEVEQLEAKITEAQAVIDNATERKNAILAKYL